MNQDTLLNQVKCVVRAVEPEAEIILYGSRARREASPHSDWDFLVLVDGPVDDERTDKIRHALYEIEWDVGEVLSAIVRDRRQWNRPPYRDTPFHHQVQRDGRRL